MQIESIFAEQKMPRSSSASRSAPRPAPRPIARVTPAPPPPSYSPPPTISLAPQSFGQTMKDGMALGIGSSVGQRMTSWIFGPPKVEMIGGAPAVSAAPKPPCDEWAQLKNSLDTCLVDNINDHRICAKQIDAFRECITRGGNGS